MKRHPKAEPDADGVTRHCLRCGLSPPEAQQVHYDPLRHETHGLTGAIVVRDSDRARVAEHDGTHDIS